MIFFNSLPPRAGYPLFNDSLYLTVSESRPVARRIWNGDHSCLLITQLTLVCLMLYHRLLALSRGEC